MKGQIKTFGKRTYQLQTTDGKPLSARHRTRIECYTDYQKERKRALRNKASK